MKELQSDAINEAIAEKIFGAEIVRSPFSPIVLCEFPDHDLTSYYPHMPKFCTDMVYAWKVKEKIGTMGMQRRIYFTDRLIALITAENAGQFPPGHVLHPADLIFEVKPHHICIAALETVAQDFGVPQI